jgi:hypothetical protein
VAAAMYAIGFAETVRDLLKVTITGKYIFSWY